MHQDGITPQTIRHLRVWASVMFTGTLFATIVAALEGVWVAAGVLAFVALLMLMLVIYGVHTASGLREK